MDDKAQAEGEKRVRENLIDPLLARGFVRTSGLNVARFEAMCADLCKRLAYMSAEGLRALEEVAAGRPTGKQKNGFPDGNRIREWAAQIEPPADTGSPLLRKVFAARVGQDAIAQGWAPELLREVKKNRLWPNEYIIRKAEEDGRAAAAQLRRLSEDVANGVGLSEDKSTWRNRRLEAIAKCEELARLGMAA